MSTQVNSYTVVDPKGVVWDGKRIAKDGEIISTATDGRIKTYVHFKQIKLKEKVGEVESPKTAAPAAVVGDPKVGRETLAPVANKAVGDVAPPANPQPAAQPEITAKPSADGTTTVVHQDGNELPVFEELQYRDLVAWATDKNIDLSAGRSQEAVLAAIRKIYPLK